jgi:hypothetical protein
MPLTLDEFKSKYPFKLNDWVFEKKDPSYVFNISKIKFKYDKIVYEGRNKDGDVITRDANQLNQIESLPIHISTSENSYYTYNGDFKDNSKLYISSDISKVEFPNDLEIDKIEDNIIHFKKRES